LLRLNSNGTRDQTFGNDGQALGFAAGSYPIDHVYDMTTDSQDRIIVTGAHESNGVFNSGMIVERFLPNGSPDDAFGDHGIVVVTVPAAPGAGPYFSQLGESVAVDSIGRILVGGYGDGGYWSAVRLLGDGTPDSSFGGGSGAFSIPSAQGDINTIIPASDGKIYAVGSDYHSTNAWHMSAMRLLDDGSPDPTFGTGGKVDRPLQNNTVGWSWTALLRPDGRLLMAGGEQVVQYGVENTVVYSVMPDGSADPTFGQAGRSTMNLGDNVSSDARNMILRPDGTLILVGDVGVGDDSFPTLQAFDASGNPKADFGTNGRIQISNFFIVSAIAQDDKGKIIVGGNFDQATTQIEVSRFVPYPVLEVKGEGAASAAATMSALPAAASALPAIVAAPQFVLGRTGDLSQPTSVQVTFTGVGADGKTQGTDVVPVTFATGVISVSLPLATYGNLVLHGTGSVRMSVSDPGMLQVLGSSSATLAYTAPSASSQISGSEFNDVNLNGKRDTGDAGLAGRTIFIDKNHNGRLDAGETSTLTDANGNYQFAHLPAGTYRITRGAPAGYRSSTSAPAYRDVTVSGTSVVGGISFGLTKLALLSGTFFNDLNGSAHRDTGEPLLSGWKVFIDANKDGKWESNEHYAITTTSGVWSFSLSSGTYRVRVVALTGWKLTTVAATQLRTLAAGQTLTGVPIGMKKA
jgi:uncharacterized delta-60 repeat protein